MLVSMLITVSKVHRATPVASTSLIIITTMVLHVMLIIRFLAVEAHSLTIRRGKVVLVGHLA